ncbi:MAG: deaminase [Fibrobacteraceae bacterium]|nr:deaminase [Fibrobacteraceae bacterium]
MVHSEAETKVNAKVNRGRLRDEVYTQMMLAQAKLSKDTNTKMGAVLVSGDGRVLSTGYNGAPSGFDDATIPYTREKQLLAYDLLDADSGEFISHREFEANKYPFMVHAEINALHYARGKVPPGSKLYVIGFPCERCALDVSLAGVSEVYVTKDDYDPNSTLNNSRDTAYYMFAQAGIIVTLCGRRIRPVISKLRQ